MPGPRQAARCSASVRLAAARAARAHREQGIGVGNELDGIRRDCGSVTRVRTSALTGTGDGPSAYHSIRCSSAGLQTPSIAAASAVPHHAFRLISCSRNGLTRSHAD